MPDEIKRRARGRPPLTHKQIADMRDHISSCALRLFQTEGYEAVSMRRLAREANLTPLTLYKYFDNKIDILRALWAEVFAEMFNTLDDIAAHEPAPLARLHAVALGYVSYWLDNRQNYFMVFMSKGVSQTDVTGFIQDTATLQRFDLLGNCLSAALDTGATPETHRLKSELLLCILNGIAHNLITISSYPWSNPKEIVRVAIEGLVVQ